MLGLLGCTLSRLGHPHHHPRCCRSCLALFIEHFNRSVLRSYLPMPTMRFGGQWIDGLSSSFNVGRQALPLQSSSLRGRLTAGVRFQHPATSSNARKRHSWDSWDASLRAQPADHVAPESIAPSSLAQRVPGSRGETSGPCFSCLRCRPTPTTKPAKSHVASTLANLHPNLSAGSLSALGRSLASCRSYTHDGQEQWYGLQIRAACGSAAAASS